MQRPEIESAARWALSAFLVCVPFGAAYAVLVQRLLEVKTLLRRAVQYAFARYTIMFASFLPFLVVAAILYRSREQTVASVLAGPGFLILTTFVVVGTIATRLRTRILDTLDRRFFREQYDPHAVLSSFADSARDARDAGDLSAAVMREVDGALHVTAIDVLRLDVEERCLVGTREETAPLTFDSRLTLSLLSEEAPITLDAEDGDTPVHLTPDERAWMQDNGYRLFIPVLGSTSPLLAIVALGAKKSELEFTDEDRVFLMSIATSFGMALERIVLLAAGPDVVRRMRMWTTASYSGRPAASTRRGERGDDRGVAQRC